MDSIKKVSIGEIKENKEELLNSMKGLVHTAKDIFGSTPFKDEYIAVGTDNIITIEVGGNTYPVHYTPNTIAMIDGDLSITDYIFDEENYLSLSDDDDMMWFSLVMQLGHQIELLQNENNQYSDDFVNANEEIDKLKCELAEEIKARQGYEEALKEANKQLSDPDTITSQSRMEDAYTKRVLELLGKIEELENDNKRLSERVKTLVIEKSGKLEKSAEEKTEKPASEIIKECVGDKVNLETAMILQENNKLKEEIQSLRII